MKKQIARVRRRLKRRRPHSIPLSTRLDQRPDLREYEIGRFTRGHLTVADHDPGTHLVIGQFCEFAYGTQIILGGEHVTNLVSTYRFPANPPFDTRFNHLESRTRTTKGDVSIGNDVWLGQDSLITSGVTIGNGVVVGAGSVVRKDIPAYAIVAGNPARVIGYRFSSVEIEQLEEIQWWDWPIDRIVNSIPFLVSDEINGLLRFAGHPSASDSDG